MNNPVAWQLWDAEALEAAKAQNKLVFVSIGEPISSCSRRTRRALEIEYIGGNWADPGT